MNLSLLLLALVFVSLSTTEIFPQVVKENFLKPYFVKVLPCLLIWIAAGYEMMTGRFQRPAEDAGVPAVI